MNKNLLILLFIITFPASCVKIDSSAVSNSNSTVLSNLSKNSKGTAKAQPAQGKANVQGKVLYNGKPAVGIEVRLCEHFNPYVGNCEKVGGEIYKVKTDANGEYLFANITPRVYGGLLYGVFETKDYLYLANLYNQPAEVKVDPDTTFFADDMSLFKQDVKIRSPKNYDKVNAQELEIKWDAYPDAASYKLTLNGVEAGGDHIKTSVDTNSYKPEKLLVDGKYQISIEADNSDKIKLAETNDDPKIEFLVVNGSPRPDQTPTLK